MCVWTSLFQAKRSHDVIYIVHFAFFFISISRTFTLPAEGWVFKSYPRQTSVLKTYHIENSTANRSATFECHVSSVMTNLNRCHSRCGCWRTFTALHIHILSLHPGKFQANWWRKTILNVVIVAFFFCFYFIFEKKSVALHSRKSNPFFSRLLKFGWTLTKRTIINYSLLSFKTMVLWNFD